MFRTIKEKLGFSIKRNLPRHIAISLSGRKEWSKENGKTLAAGMKKSCKNIIKVLEQQTKLEIPVITILAHSQKIQLSSQFDTIIDGLVDMFKEIRELDIIHKEKIKISVLGKWYDLPQRAVDEIKELVGATKDYDNFFFNICINYDGRQEIVDAFRILARKVKLGNLDPNAITEEDIKNNVYSSYFPPPELMILTAGRKKTKGFLLWDSPNTKIKTVEKKWPEMTVTDLKKAMSDFSRD